MNHKLEKVDSKIVNEFDKLPLDYWDFNGVDTQVIVHGLHRYPAMMIYPISRNILKVVKKYQNNINSILDPFMGSGTVLVEGVVAGLNNIYGNDLNPLARLIAKVKTTYVSEEILNNKIKNFLKNLNKKFTYHSSFISNVNKYLKNRKIDIFGNGKWKNNAGQIVNEYSYEKGVNINIPTFFNMGYWFKPKVIIELSIIKKTITNVKNKRVRNFLLVAFSEVVRKVSNTRNGEFKAYRMKKNKLKKFNPQTQKIFENKLKSNLKKFLKYQRDYKKGLKKSKVSIIANNTKNLKGIPNNSIDVMITSPPYGDSRTTVAYGQYSRFSLQWLNYSDFYIEKDEKKKINAIDKNLLGGEKVKKNFKYNLSSKILKNSLEKIRKKDNKRARQVYSFYEGLKETINEINKKMKKNSYQFWVVGNRTVKKETLMTDKILVEMAKNCGLEYVCKVGRNIPNKVMPSLNSPTNEVGEKMNTMINEHIVVLRK